MFHRKVRHIKPKMLRVDHTAAERKIAALQPAAKSCKQDSFVYPFCSMEFIKIEKDLACVIRDSMQSLENGMVL